MRRPTARIAPPPDHERRRQRPAASRTLLGHPLRRARRAACRARQRDRERRAADHRARPARHRRRLDLGRQRLSAHHHDLAAAAGCAGRPNRLPARLCRRARAVHGFVAGLRAGRFARLARGDARGPGLRRGRHHERQHRAGADDLPAAPARAGRLAQRDGGGARLGDRADHRVGRARGHDLAVAVRDQRADRHRGRRGRPSRSACARCRSRAATTRRTTIRARS